MKIKDVDAFTSDETVIFRRNELERNIPPYEYDTIEDIDPHSYEEVGLRILKEGLMPFELFSQYDMSTNVDVNPNNTKTQAETLDNGQLVMSLPDIIRWKIKIGRESDLVYCAALLTTLEESSDHLPIETHTEFEKILAEKITNGRT